MSIKVAKQYIKNLSINLPNSPQIFTIESQDKPNIEIVIDIDAKKMSDLAYEVILKLKAIASKGDLFTININYAGIFSLEEGDNIENLEKTLLVDCPQLLFPYCRNIISNLTSDAGFSPMMLDPMDFEALYKKRKESITVN